MNLEAIEQRCLAYLKEVRRPLVPIAQLLTVLRDDDNCADVSEAELLGFLRKHELFTVVEPQGLAAENDGLADLAAAGMMTAPCVILATRLPSKSELTSALQQQMGAILGALEAAMNQAHGQNKPKLAMEAQAVLRRARELQQKLDDAGLTEN